MRTPVLVASGLAALIAARELRVAAVGIREGWPKTLDEPWAPSTSAAPFVSLGYREALADYLWVRVIGYFGGHGDTAQGVEALIRGIAALDPHFGRVWDWGARAMTMADHGVDQDTYLRSIDFLETGMRFYPEDWHLPLLAGQTYIVDVHSKDPAQERAWQEAGTNLLEKAIRMPGAPADQATLAAHLRTKLGQHDRAVRELREMILITDDASAKKEMIDKLAALEQRDANSLEAAMDDERKAFQSAWLRDRPELPATMYVLLGPLPHPYIDFSELAADRDLIGSEAEPLEPINYDDAPTAASGSGSPSR
jgi:hypothetical protein